MKRTNEILEDHGDWLLVDISTPKFPDATMAVDKDVFDAYEGGRISAKGTFGHNNYIYASCLINRIPRYFHRLVVGRDGVEVDHIQHGTMSFVDNRRINLRHATKSQNRMNSRLRKDSGSGITGVHWHKKTGQWMAYISVEGKIVHLGRFDNVEFAIGARQQAEREYFGEYAFNAENA